MWKLANGITDPASGASVGGMVLGIKQIVLDHRGKTAVVPWAIWTERTARDAGKSPVIDNGYYCEFNDACPVAGGQYTPIFGDTALTAAPNATTAAAYAAMPNNPQVAALLVGATEG